MDVTHTAILRETHRVSQANIIAHIPIRWHRFQHNNTEVSLRFCSASHLMGNPPLRNTQNVRIGLRVIMNRRSGDQIKVIVHLQE